MSVIKLHTVILFGLRFGMTHIYKYHCDIGVQFYCQQSEAYIKYSFKCHWHDQGSKV